ncbi:MAG TPA: hypothetical protein VFW07_16935 [Parafilimonas sp.]|nr:hypothetical protein [Parafilimonas sp.]
MSRLHTHWVIFCVAALPSFSCKKDITSDLQQVSSSVSGDSYKETSPPVQTPVSYAINSNIGGYLEALPASYAKHAKKKYPLIIFLHGLGETGNGTTDLYKVAVNAVPKLIQDGQFPSNFTVKDKYFQFIVLSPQFKDWPQPSDVNAVLNLAIQKYRVDTMRVYVCGLSMGGGATWDYAIDYGKRLAAIVPISGASWPTTDKAAKIAQSGVRVWAFHNQDDSTVPSWYSINYVSYINNSNPQVPARLTLFPVNGHDAWTKATDPGYKENGKNIYEWMLSKR